jgi:hypothetical protein
MGWGVGDRGSGIGSNRKTFPTPDPRPLILYALLMQIALPHLDAWSKLWNINSFSFVS